MKLKALFAAITAYAAIASLAHADENNVRETLAAKYPGTPIKSITKTPIPGVYEMVMGKNVVYVAEDGRYFIFGSLFDMQTQMDLSANIREQAQRIDVSSIPLENAVVTVKGSGERKMIVFTDPDCPYCKQLAKTLDRMTNVTVYNILYPIAGLHPDAERKAEAIYCAPPDKRDQILNDWFVNGKPIPQSRATCPNPTAQNVRLAKSLGMNGTPMIVSMDGRVLPGAADQTQLDEFLAPHQ